MTRSLCSSTNQALAITVTAVNDNAPVITSSATVSFVENGTGTVIDVNALTLNPNEDVSLPPFAEALRLLERGREPPLLDDADTLDEDERDEAGGRDLLGEMEIAARIMITGGDERDDGRDNYLLGV